MWAEAMADPEDADVLPPLSDTDGLALPENKDMHLEVLRSRVPEPERPEEKSPLDELEDSVRIPNVRNQGKAAQTKRRKLAKLVKASRLVATLLSKRDAKQAVARTKKAAKPIKGKASKEPLIVEPGPLLLAQEPLPEAAKASPATAVPVPEGLDGPLMDAEAALEFLPRLSEYSQSQLRLLPAECMPTHLGGGTGNYTIKAHDGETVCEIQLANRCFRIKKAKVFPDPTVVLCRTIKWTGRSTFEAWAEYKEKVQWPAAPKYSQVF